MYYSSAHGITFRVSEERFVCDIHAQGRSISMPKHALKHIAVGTICMDVSEVGYSCGIRALKIFVPKDGRLRSFRDSASVHR
jgi:hypothetical protein